MPPTDTPEVTSVSYYGSSRSLRIPEHLLSRTTDCYLGRYSDEETGSILEAGFITQFNCVEDFEFPDSVFGLEQFQFADSLVSKLTDDRPFKANLRLYFSDLTGDADNPLKIEVWPLDKSVDPNVRYYPDTDPTLFYDESGIPLASIMISPNDYVVDDSIRSLKTYYNNINITLPDSIAERMIRTYYSTTEDGKAKFRNTPAFIENICKGFFVKCVQGDGTLLRIDGSTLQIGFKHLEYEDEDGEEINPTELSASIAEFLGGSEVMQLNIFNNLNLDGLVSERNCTYLKSPYGICTELTLPLDEISTGNEIINSASLSLQAFRNSEGSYSNRMPDGILLVRESELYNFFDRISSPDNRTSFYTKLNAAYNQYTFNNISRLVTQCIEERSEWLASHKLNEDAAGFAEYAEAFPDWNKVILIPVKPQTDANDAILYFDMDVNPSFVKLKGGPDGDRIEVKVISTVY